MNKSLKEQLEYLWCATGESVKPLEWREPVVKPTEPHQESSNDINPTSDRLKCDEVLNGR